MQDLKIPSGELCALRCCNLSSMLYIPLRREYQKYAALLLQIYLAWYFYLTSPTIVCAVGRNTKKMEHKTEGIVCPAWLQKWWKHWIWSIWRGKFLPNQTFLISEILLLHAKKKCCSQVTVPRWCRNCHLRRIFQASGYESKYLQGCVPIFEQTAKFLLKWVWSDFAYLPQITENYCQSRNVFSLSINHTWFAVAQLFLISLNPKALSSKIILTQSFQVCKDDNLVTKPSF